MGDSEKLVPKAITQATTPAVEQAQLPKPQPIPPPPEPKKDQFDPPKGDLRDEAKKWAQTPREIGRKIPSERMPSAPLKKPISITPEHFRRFSQEPIVRQKNLGDFAKPLPKNQLSFLIRMRNQAENRPNFRQIIRYEIQEHRKLNPVAEKNAPSEPLNEAKNRSEKVATETGADQSPAKTTSVFEKVLKQNRAGRVLLENLPEGAKARPPQKSEAGWKNFFSNILNRGSLERPSSRQLSSFVEGFFRGTYRSGTDGAAMILVSDLRFKQGERVAAEKFARIKLENAESAQKFGNMAPGDTLPHEAAKVLTQDGERLEFTQLYPESADTKPETAEAGERALDQLRSQSNTAAVARWEATLMQERARRQEDFKERENPGLGAEISRKRGRSFLPWFPFAWDRQQSAERPPGKPRFWIFFGYTLATIIGSLLVFIILRAII